MASKRPFIRKKSPAVVKIADPATLLAAAEKAPVVFNIASYFRPVFVMRQKGYSWRDLEKWGASFGIKISAVHLRRLYVQETTRLAALSARELAAQGCPDEMITELLRKDDPTDRFTAPDPEDAALIAQRRVAAQEYGVPTEEIERIDFSEPITLGNRTI